MKKTFIEDRISQKDKNVSSVTGMQLFVIGDSQNHRFIYTPQSSYNHQHSHQ